VIGDHTWRGTVQDIDVSDFIQQHQNDITITFETARSENEAIKYYFEMEVEFYRTGPEETDVQHTTARFYIPPMTSDVNELNLADIIAQFMEKIDGFSGQNSGWIISQINYIRLCWGCYRPLMAGTFIPTPKWIASKKAVVNVQCFDDDNCFQYSVLAGMNVIKAGTRNNKSRPSQYKPFMRMLNMDGIETPVPLSSIDKFENQNPEISVNMLYLDDKDIVPIRTSKFCNQRKYHVNLLMLTNQDKFHYTCVRSLSRLVAHRTKHNPKTYVCHYCLHPFSKEDLLNEHLPICSQHKPQQVVYPQPGKNILKFDKYHFQFEVPFAIYADFESFLQKNNDQSDTHVPSGFCVVTTSIFEDHDYQLFCYTGENVMDEFFAHMQREEQRIRTILSANEPMKDLTVEEQVKHNAATVCSSCNREFTDNRRKTRHHCHVTGKYIAPVCQICNLKLKYRKSNEHFFVPCFFHNNSAYDSHIIIKHLHSKNAKITVIPSNTEKFIGFQIDGIRYLDSFKFLPSSLDNLVQNLHNDGMEPFKYTRRTFGDSEPNIFQKGIYPYEHMADRDVFKETSLPPKEAFYSKLKMEGITNDEYERAQQMWTRYGCQTMEDYTSLYVKLDTVLLADVFEQFRRLAFWQYGLDPAHCWTLAGYTWEAALKFTGVQLELITDPNIYLMVESAIRGGISTVSNRLATANNKYLEKKSYDPSKPTSFIMSWDVINLYGYCMLSKLPCGNFQFLEDPENFDFETVQYDDDTGYILEVDLQYPDELHDSHSDLPLAPEHLKVMPDMLSDYSKTDTNFHGQVALTPNLYDKTKYVLYLRNLQLYTQLGMKVQKIHRVLAFDQKAYLAPYILYNTEKRQQARSDFEKDLYKLLSNAVYGKTIEQLRKRTHIKLISDPNEAKRYIRKPTCQSFHIINEDLTMVHLGKKKIQMNKPIFAGMVILDIAKTVVYELHYNYILKKFSSEKAKLLFTDTDSLTYSIETGDIYEEILPDAAEHFDCSEYPKSHVLFSTVNKKRLGKWKDENSKTGPIRQFVGIRAKMYSIRCVNKDHNKLKAKGIVKVYCQRKLRHRHFLRALHKKKTTSAKFWLIRSSIHNLKTVLVNKSSLNPSDCKRYVLHNGINTLAYGHYSLR